MTKPERGVKRVCASCGTRFFDLDHEPIICPKCQAVFVVPEPPQPRYGAYVSAPKRAATPPLVEEPEDLLDEPDEEETLPAPDEDEEVPQAIDEDEGVPRALDEVVDVEIADLEQDNLPDDE